MAVKQEAKKTLEYREAAKKRRRSVWRRNLLIGAASLLVLLVTLFLVVDLLIDRKATPRYGFLTAGAIDEVVTVQATVLQETSLLTAAVDGLFVSYLPSGSRVAAGQTVGLLVDPEYQAELDGLLELKARIRKRQNSLALKRSHRPLQAQSLVAAARLSELLDTVRVLSSIDDTLALPDWGEALEALLFETDLDLAREAFDDPELGAWIESWEEGLASLEARSSRLQSERAGLLCFGVQAVPENLLAAGDGERLLSRDQLVTGGLTSLEPLSFYQQGDVVATLLTSPEASVAWALDDGQDIDEKVSYGLRLPGTTAWETVPVTSLQRDAQGLLMTVELPTALTSFRQQMAGPLEFRRSRTEGLVLSLRSLLEYDPTDGIAILYKVADGRIRRVPVFVLTTSADQAVIRGRDGDPLAPSPYDVYVINPESAREGDYLD